jgi:hypothetical protein
MIQAESNSRARPALPWRAFLWEAGMEEGVIAWAVEVDASEWSFAQRFTRHGNGGLAAKEADYAESCLRSRASTLLTKAEIVVACLEVVELDRRKGIPLLPVVRRKLAASIARARKRGGATAESAAALPKLEQAVEEFRRHHGFEERELRSAPRPHSKSPVRSRPRER